MKKKKRGHAATEIDWAEVGEFAEAGSTGIEIAAHLGITPRTFYERCLKERGRYWQHIVQEHYSHGNAKLRLAQFKRALKGNAEMLKLLGQQRLGQFDRAALNVTTNFNLDIPRLSMEELKRLQANPNLAALTAPEGGFKQDDQIEDAEIISETIHADARTTD